LCTNPTPFVFTMNAMGNSGPLGTAATCHEITTTLTIQSGGCSNFNIDTGSPRTFKINGTSVLNTGSWGTPLPAKVRGGYCFQATAGMPDYASFYTF
jgi:hypothetical protein